MRVKTMTDYALRALIYLSGRRGFVVGKEMCDALGIAENYLPKVRYRLRHAGWVTSGTGTSGGYALTIDPGKLTLLDVMNVTEESAVISECLTDCEKIEYMNSMYELYTGFQKIYEDYFSAQTIADMAKKDGYLRNEKRHF